MTRISVSQCSTLPSHRGSASAEKGSTSFSTDIAPLPSLIKGEPAQPVSPSEPARPSHALHLGEAVEPLRWRFHLRKGVTFHGESKFTADDVLFSAQRARAPGLDLKTRIPAEAAFVKVDDHTVDVVLRTPNPVLPAEWDT